MEAGTLVNRLACMNVVKIGPPTQICKMAAVGIVAARETACQASNPGQISADRAEGCLLVTRNSWLHVLSLHCDNQTGGLGLRTATTGGERGGSGGAPFKHWPTLPSAVATALAKAPPFPAAVAVA